MQIHTKQGVALRNVSMCIMGIGAAVLEYVHLLVPLTTISVTTQHSYVSMCARLQTPLSALLILLAIIPPIIV
jgi:hypothetical protein